jgi:predicted ATPase
MADVGLGYSQLVPVAVQLWAARRRQGAFRRIVSGGRYIQERHSPPSVVVEQPELHLHPAYQARLADVFAAAIKNDTSPDSRSTNSPLTIVAETHSPNLISRLGELINSGKLPSDQVQILVFEESGEIGGGATVRVAKFNEKGILSNWPIGFFDA